VWYLPARFVPVTVLRRPDAFQIGAVARVRNAGHKGRDELREGALSSILKDAGASDSLQQLS
jgi:hypothetical protein